MREIPNCCPVDSLKKRPIRTETRTPSASSAGHVTLRAVSLVNSVNCATCPSEEKTRADAICRVHFIMHGTSTRKCPCAKRRKIPKPRKTTKRRKITYRWKPTKRRKITKTRKSTKRRKITKWRKITKRRKLLNGGKVLNGGNLVPI